MLVLQCWSLGGLDGLSGWQISGSSGLSWIYGLFLPLRNTIYLDHTNLLFPSRTIDTWFVSRRHLKNQDENLPKARHLGVTSPHAKLSRRATWFRKKHTFVFSPLSCIVLHCLTFPAAQSTKEQAVPGAEWAAFPALTQSGWRHSRVHKTINISAYLAHSQLILPPKALPFPRQQRGISCWVH